MIGDWVQIQDYVTRVASIDLHSVRCEGIVRWLAQIDVQPIPLTPEILEKNGISGWTGGGDSTKMACTPYGAEGLRYAIYVGFKHKDIEVHCAPPVEVKPGWRKHNKVYLEVCGHYVHELQHALRMCGIDKEIVL